MSVAYSTRRFQFAAGHRYWVPAWPAADNERVFGRLKVLTVAHALHAPARTHILDGLIAPGEFSVWWGGPKTGKTFLLLRIGY